MKELDILLGQFLDSQSVALARGRWPGLEELLAAEDDVLWDWLQNPNLAPDDSQRTLLDAIRRLDVHTD